MVIKIMGAYRRMYETPDTKMDFIAYHAHVLVHFHNPMRIAINGVEQITEPDAWVFFTPDCRQQYSAYSGEFINDYIWAKLYDESIPEKYHIPLNEVFYLEQLDIPLECIAFITWMLTDVLNDHTELMEKEYFKCLESLSGCIIKQRPKMKRDSISRKMYADLRKDMAEHPEKWSVDELAKSVYLTRSHFSVQYTNLFGISPGEDLKQMTVAKAEKLLNDTDYSVSEIAEMLGYANSENFIRAFKRKKGVTPHKYRK